MCPTDPSNPPNPFSFKLVDLLHSVAERSEEVQTLAERMAGDLYAAKITEEQAHVDARRLEGLCRVLAASASRLAEEVTGSSVDD